MRIKPQVKKQNKTMHITLYYLFNINQVKIQKQIQKKKKSNIMYWLIELSLASFVQMQHSKLGLYWHVS